MHDLNICCYVCMFSISLLNKILFLLSQPLCFCSKNFHLKKKVDIFHFSSYFFLCPLIMFTLLVVTLLTLFFYPRFALLMFIYSLLCFFCLCSFLFLRNHFWISSIYFPFCKTLLVMFPFFVSRLFLIVFFFNRVLSNKRNWQLFFWQKNHVFNPSKNLSFEFLLFDFSKKSFIIFRSSYFLKSLFQKNLIFWTSWKIPFPFF